MLLREAINQFDKFTQVTRSLGTQDYYKYYLKTLTEHLGDLECENISNNEILDYIISRRNFNPIVTNASINKHIITLKTVVKYATGRVISFSKLKERKKIIPTISETTYNKIFDYHKKHIKDSFQFRNYVFLKLLLDTGLRLHEIINIKVKNIDFDTSSIHIKITKTDVDRYVCFTESTKQLLLKFLVTHNMKEFLFYDFRSKKS